MQQPPYNQSLHSTRSALRYAMESRSPWTIFFLRPTGRFPTIIEITPYGRDLSSPNFRNEAAYWIKHGYAFVIADTRGTGESEGKFVFIAKEGVDAYDLIEWIARQPWSNGHVTMRGASYSGVNQWAAALQQPPHLSCISPSATLERPMRDVPYDNGAFTLWWALTWIGSDIKTLLFRRPVNRSAVQIRKHGLSIVPSAPWTCSPQDEKFLSIGHSSIIRPTMTSGDRSISLPMLSRRSRYRPWRSRAGSTATLRGTIQNFHNVRNYSTNPNDHFLFIGPYVHTTAVDGGYDYLTLGSQFRPWVISSYRKMVFWTGSWT